MSHLVTHHKEKLVLLQLLDQRVPKDNALGLQETRHIGIDRLGIDTLVDLKDAASLDARPICE